MDGFSDDLERMMLFSAYHDCAHVRFLAHTFLVVKHSWSECGRGDIANATPDELLNAAILSTAGVKFCGDSREWFEKRRDSTAP